MRSVHLIGIGGAGVSALARVFLARGDLVTGCDQRASATTEALLREGAGVVTGHDPAHVRGVDLVVYSGAIGASAELDAARDAGIQVLTRAEALAGLIAQHDSVAVAGTHGKTTVSFMLGHILTRAGWDPSVLVGDGTSSRAGRSRWLVAEADESDGSLALHRPRHAILTNCEFDHSDHFASVDEVRSLFAGFLAVLPEAGIAVVCADDPLLTELGTPARRVTYGFAGGAGYRPGEGVLEGLKLPVPGRHNLVNAAGAAAMAIELGVDPKVTLAALATFPGAHRRLENLGSWRGATLYDDYGHHPTEVSATLQAARELPHRRLIVVFQPHRYSRYLQFEAGFAAALGGADSVVVTEIYPAGEANPGGVTAEPLADAAGGRFAADFTTARHLLEETVEAGDLVLFMGAGDIWRLGGELAQQG